MRVHEIYLESQNPAGSRSCYHSGNLKSDRGKEREGLTPKASAFSSSPHYFLRSENCCLAKLLPSECWLKIPNTAVTCDDVITIK